ncbi:hypothetical protein ABEB36_011498 [Hypothenemus hampei]|uniref:protein-tyrosine-phosphatase n=1 Tax=Hypothenemus hampei TaxID=57062 RepID=A0ABD1EFQ4_HYPHA
MNFDLEDYENDSKISLFDSNSRDSGYEEILHGSIGDDYFLEVFTTITFPPRHSLPTDFSNLLRKTIKTNDPASPLRRSQSLVDTASPLKKKICQRSEQKNRKETLTLEKKAFFKLHEREVPKTKTVKTFMCSAEKIKLAVQKSFDDPDLIGDFSRNYLLPLASSRHQDLKAIDTNTLTRLLNGEFNQRVTSFKIIDCRYPYEFEGGHIEGAVNIYTHEQCSALLEEIRSDQLEILIFHCEFSSERGPNLCRYLRQEDRKRNAHLYPFLCFPEVYILEGGYKKFFEEYSNKCSPNGYVTMLDPKHNEEMILCRQTSKTWNCDVKVSGKKRKPTFLRLRNSRKLLL